MQLLRFLDTRVCVTHTAEVPARPAGASELVAAGPSRCPLALRSSRWAESGARPQVPAALRARPPRGPPWPAHTPAEGPPSLPGGGGTHPSPSFALPSVLFLSPGPRGVSRDSCSAGGRVGVPGAGRGSREAAPALLRPPPRPPPFSGALRPEPWGGRGRRSRPGPAGFQRGRPSHRCRPGERNPRGSAASLQPEVAQYARPGPRRASQRNKAERSTSRSKQTGRHATP